MYFLIIPSHFPINYTLYSISCVVVGYCIKKVKCDVASVSVFSPPDMYMISGPYNYIVRLQWNTISIVKYLNVNLWSVYIHIRIQIRTALSSLSVSNALGSYS